jgi:O-antigen ligase
MVNPSGQAVSDVQRTRRLQIAVAGVLLVVLAAALGPVGGILAAAGKGFAIAFVAVLFMPVLFWRVPASPLVVFVAAATSIERFADPNPDAITARVPLFRSFAETYGLSGAIVLPIELLIGLALLVWLAKGVSERRVQLRASPLGITVTVLFGIAVAMELFGLARGGIFHISLWELRPFLYLAAAYLLASQLVSKRAALEAILWGVVIGTGLKGVLGTERVITWANIVPKPEAILEHDESFFFSLFILLTLALWLFGKRGWLRRVAMLLLPFVVTADLGNNRRAAWVILPATLLALAVVFYVRTPDRRRVTGWVVGVLLLVGTGYVLVFKNSTSLVAQPAHAIWSQFQADPRDASSNLYRQLENANLAIDIKVAAFTGTGFGVPIAHPIPLYDASNIDPLINFIPHNNILYVWLRLGTLGAIAFWCLVGAAIVSACRLARHPDRDLGLFGVVGLVAVMAWLVQGYLDMGIVSFRIILLVGTVLGAVTAAHRMAAEEAKAAAAPQESTGQELRIMPPYRRRRLLAEPAAASSSTLTGS